MNDARTDARHAILTRALHAAPFVGWSQQTLESAITTSGAEPALAKDAFPGGIKQLLAFFMTEADRSMVEEAA
ncbi:MAG: COQ9 family protein, partial [Alphaproteobacteria bacterium]|nr:COQ9 family protein [Alphaproteobacteria bacterium]